VVWIIERGGRKCLDMSLGLPDINIFHLALAACNMMQFYLVNSMASALSGVRDGDRGLL
jgi:hypothetical protein